MREGQILVTKTVLPEMDEYIEEIKDLCNWIYYVGFNCNKCTWGK